MTLKKESHLHLWLIVSLLSLLFTFKLWDHYFNSSYPIDRELVSSIVLTLGTLLSGLIGYFLWTLESGREYLKREVERQTEALLSQERETAAALAKSIAARQRQRELEDAYNQMRLLQDELIQSEKLASIGRVVAGVVHELNSPLTTIEGYVRILQERLSGDAEMLSRLEVVKRQSAHAHEVVNDLLHFMRRQKMNLSGVNPAGLADEAIELSRPEIEKFEVECTKAYSQDLPQITVDPDQIRRVIMNLIRNAAQALQGHDAPRKIHVGLVKAGTMVQFYIADNGPGIPRDLLKRIFEPFFTTKPAGQGTGLGLSLSAGIIQAHGGKVSVESEEGRGTTFVVELPVQAQAGLPGMPETADHAKPTAQILLVEPDGHLADFIGRLFSAWGYAFRTVSTIDETMYLLRSHPKDFHALVTEMDLTTGGAEVLVNEIWADRRFTAMPIFVMTGKEDPEEEAKIAALGLGALFKKPFAWNLLKQSLDSALKLKGLTGA